MGFQVQVTGLKEMIAALTAAIAEGEAAVETFTSEVSKDAFAQLQAATPYDAAPDNGVIPGEAEHLRDSYDTLGPDVSGFTAIAIIYTNEPIKFGYVTGGTSGPIVPVIKKGLWWPELAHPVSHVNGQAANPFHERIVPSIETDGQVLGLEMVDAWLGNL